MNKEQMKEYNLIREQCDLLKLDYRRVKDRKRRTNQSWQEAIEWVKDHPLGFTYGGVHFSSMKNCCERLNVSYDHVTRAKDISRERAIFILLLLEGYVFLEGEKSSLKEIASQLNLSDKFVFEFLLHGGSLNELMQRK